MRIASLSERLEAAIHSSGRVTGQPASIEERVTDGLATTLEQSLPTPKGNGAASTGLKLTPGLS